MSKRIPPVLARLAAVCLCLMLVAPAVFAQSQATTGDIEGRVLDPNGAVVPNATVTARNEATGFERTANTDGDGNYRIILLPPGTYAVEATANGFNKVGTNAVQVTVGSRTSLDLNLAAGGVTETVLVSTEPPTVETTRTSVATTINERSIQNLPINGRNFQDFATLSPGVIRDPRGGDLSVGGQRGTLNSLQVDGVDNNNTFFGQALGRGGVRPPYQFSEESVQEFQVNQNGFSAEFGRAGGAVINVVTKSGTNNFHGSAFEFFRDEALNSNTPILTARGAKRPKSQINQFGGTFGGPIKHDRAFFFFAYDGQRSNIPNVTEARIQTGGGFLQLGRNNFSPRETTIKRAQFIDIVSYTRGKHNLKFGADLNFDRVFNFFPGLFSGQFTFNSYALFASNTPASFTQNFPGPGTTGGETHPDPKEYGFFVQDDWRVNPKLTLNLGLR